MKKVLTGLFYLLLVTKVTGQGKLQDFKPITVDDMLLKTCPFEPDAPAMKMAEVEMASFEILGYAENTRIKIEKKVRIKIFNEQGYKHASIKIPYYSKKGQGKIKELEGAVYNLDGTGKITVQRLSKDDFFKEKAAENVGLLTFAFPDVKPGSIIEYSFVKIELGFVQFDPWVIQDEIPTGFISSTYTFPVTSLFREKIYGTDSIQIKKERFRGGQMMKITYGRQHVPSFKPEPFMSSYKDNLMRAFFIHIPYGGYMGGAMMSEKAVWKGVGSFLLQDTSFGGKIKKLIPGTQPLIDSAKKIIALPERVKFIYEAVRKRIPEKTEQTFRPENIIEAWDSHSGSTADINMILLNLLTSAGLKAYPLLISTRDHGRIRKDFPSFGQLNGLDVVVNIDSVQIYILDASLKFQSIHTPPYNILNRESLLLNPDKIDWFYVSDGRPLLKQAMSAFCDLDSSGIISGLASVQHYDYAKSFALDSTLEDNSNKEEKYFDRKLPGMKIISVKRESTNNDEDPLFESVEFTYEPQSSDKFYFINPQFLSPIKKNVLVSKERRTDIDMGCNQEFITTISLSLPENYEVDFLPKNIIVRAPDSSFSFKRNYSVSGTTLYLSQIFEIKRAVFEKEEYPGILDFFNRLYTLMKEEVVLKKRK